MSSKISLQDIHIRTELQPGDMSYVCYRHAKIYTQEYGFGASFENYVLAGVYEFCQSYDPERDRVWVCEHFGNIIGFLLVMHRENNAAQLRYFYIEQEYRGLGLGAKLMQLFMDFFKQCGYASSYLWTVDELPAAAALYTRHGFVLKEEKESTAFGKPLKEQCYELIVLSQ